MSKKRRTSDFNQPGILRFSERNPRGAGADWLEFAYTPSETDRIMRAIGIAIERHPEKSITAGRLLGEICEEWMAIHIPE